MITNDLDYNDGIREVYDSLFPHIGHSGIHIESVSVLRSLMHQTDGRPDAVMIVCDQCDGDNFILTTDHPDTEGCFWIG